MVTSPLPLVRALAACSLGSILFLSAVTSVTGCVSDAQDFRDVDQDDSGTANVGGSSGVGGGPSGGGSAGSTSGGSTGGGSAGSGGGSAGSGGGSAGSGGAAVCPVGLGEGFDLTPRSFELPAARCGANFDALGDTGDYHPVGYALLDLQGDDASDLVVFRDECDQEVGASHWDVYLGSPTGFQAKPVPHRLPASRCNTNFDALGYASDYHSLGYALFDLTADGRSDLVVYQDACDSELGDRRWDVYPAQADGFAAAPLPYQLPAPRCGARFDALSHPGDYDPVGYATLDLTMDGRADLVVFRDACDESVGVSHWDLYVGEASGFASVPTPYQLPAARCGSKFDALSSVDIYDPLGFSLINLTADGRPDLVVFRDDCDDAVGSSHWDVYPGEASGFGAAPLGFQLPAARCNTTFDSLGAADGYGALGYGLLDFTCDKVPDLAVFQDACDEEIGLNHWHVYPGSASGFEASPASYRLPAQRCNAGYPSTGSDGTYGGIGYALLDIGGQGRVELVVFKDSCDTEVGSARWDVYGPQ